MKKKKTKKAIVIHGLDISLNHGAIVQLKNGKLDNLFFYTDRAGSAKKSKGHGFRIDLPTTKKQPDKHIRSIIRLNWINNWISLIVKENPPYLAGLEDYAVGADQGAHYIGEVGGCARLALFNNRVRFRLHDPMSVKMFITHDGTAKKDLVERCVKRRWDVDFSHYNGTTKSSNRQTSEDLSDAFGVAMMVWMEYLLRKGLVPLSHFHEKEIRVFNRITKAFPVNILGREWILNKGE